MLGNIEGSENEAIRGLVGIADEIPRDTALKFAVKKTIIRFKANYYANRGIKNIDNNSKVHSAREDIIQAIKLDPNNPDAEYWTEILVYSKYYRLIDSGDATTQFSISQFLKEININDYKNHLLQTIKRQNNTIINNINSEIRNIDESDTEKKRVYTNYLNYMRRLLNYQLRDIKLLISSFRYNVERAYKIGELGMKNSRVSIM